MEHLHNEMADLYSVHELCEALDVSRGTFYNHIFRRVDRSSMKRKKLQLMLKVKQIFDDSEQRYGADKIRAVLAENGLRISAKRVLSIMHETRLIQHPRQMPKAIQNSTAAQKQNLLNREFNADHPNQIWVKRYYLFQNHKDSWMYFAQSSTCFLDRVVEYRVSRTARHTQLCDNATFRDAYAKRGNPKI
ncbi:MAG: IS3 family transposase [Faecalibacterium sp.]